MLSIEFIVGSFGTCLVIGFSVGQQLLAWRRSIESATSNG